MIHVGDISAEKRINHPQDVLKPARPYAPPFSKWIAKSAVSAWFEAAPADLDRRIHREHKEGDLVSGRVANIARGKATSSWARASRLPATLRRLKLAQPLPAPSREGRLVRPQFHAAAKWKHSETGGSPAGSGNRPAPVKSAASVSFAWIGTEKDRARAGQLTR